MTRKISSGRKTVFYLGMALIVIGVLLFASTFVMGAIHFGDFSNFRSHARTSVLTSLGGMGLIVVGGIMTAIGVLGRAGSGIVLDPEQAREDLEPYTRMAGGMLKDAMDEADIHIGGGHDEPEQVVKVKCRCCDHLNVETARFCNECGEQL